MRVLALSAFLLLLGASVATFQSAAGAAVPGPAGQSTVSAVAFLFLDGEPCGFLRDVSGGEIHASVVEEGQWTPTFEKKHIGAAMDFYAPVTLKLGFHLSGSVYLWVKDFVQGQVAPKSLAIYFADSTFTHISKLQISGAVITEVTIPACDGVTNEPGYLLVTIVSPFIQESPAENIDLAQYYEGPQEGWLQRRFQLAIDGLDCTKVATIGSITISAVMDTSIEAARDLPSATPHLAVSNLHITLFEDTAQSWRQWANDFIVNGNSGDENERNGHLSLFKWNQDTELAGVDFDHLGICGLERPPLDINAASGFDLYCESLALMGPWRAGVTGTPGAAGGGQPAGTAGGGQPAGAVGGAQVTAPAGGVLTRPGVGPERVTRNPAVEFATTEMPGKWCELGKAYTLGTNSPLNVAVNSVAYSAGRIKTGSGYLWPNPEQKFLVVHYAIQNPLQEAQRVGRVSIDWTAVDAQDVNREQGFVGVEDANAALDQDLKPLETVQCFTIIEVPAKGPVPKLIAAIHGDTEALVARYDLTDKVEPLPAPYAEPNDLSGSTLVEQIQGAVGNTYMTAAYDVKVDAVNFTKEKIGDRDLEADQDYCLVTLAYTNYGESGYMLNPRPRLKDADGVSYEPALGTVATTSYREIELAPSSGETVSFRLAFALPTGVALQSLTLKEEDGRPVVIDMSQYTAP
jgi:hypothetical protein